MKSLFSYGKIHFIGVLGASMSVLAGLCIDLGFSVSGSDLRISSKIADLKKKGINAYIGSDVSALKDVDLAVYTAAVPLCDTELKFCMENGIDTVTRAEFLGKTAECFDKVIAVSGTHGKSTVTAMLGEIFDRAGFMPTVHIGGDYRTFSQSSRKLFITEACEYKESFLSISADTPIVLNIESDHPDYYKTINNLEHAFEKFLINSKPHATAVTDLNVGIKTHHTTYRVGKDVFAENIWNEKGYFRFAPVLFGKRLNEIKLKVIGAHNVKNALFALLASSINGVLPEIACSALSEFTGVMRRYQIMPTINGAEIILDYAHHPTEIRAAIDAARLTSEFLTVYFQPHTYSRTDKLFGEFLKAFDRADKLVIVEEYPARETPDMGKSALELATALKKRRQCVYASLKKAKELVYTDSYKGETVLILGAGNIDSII